MLGRQKKILANISEKKSSKKGRVDENSRNFMSNVLMSVIKTTQDGNKVDEEVSDSSKQITNNKICKKLGLAAGGGSQLIKISSRKRLAFYKNDRSAVWASVPNKKFFSKIKPDLRKKIKEWVMRHLQVKGSSISNDTIQLKGKDGKKVTVGKFLLEILDRELHNDMIKPANKGGLEGAIDDDGKQIVSGTMLRSFLPENMRIMTERNKMICSCEVYITPKGLQLTLNA